LMVSGQREGRCRWTWRPGRTAGGSDRRPGSNPMNGEACGPGRVAAAVGETGYGLAVEGGVLLLGALPIFGGSTRDWKCSRRRRPEADRSQHNSCPPRSDPGAGKSVVCWRNPEQPVGGGKRCRIFRRPGGCWAASNGAPRSPAGHPEVGGAAGGRRRQGRGGRVQGFLGR